MKHVSHGTYVTFSFSDLLWPDHDFDLYLVYGPYLCKCYILLSLWILLEKFAFAAIISPVSIVDMARSDDFGIWPDLDLICDILKKILKLP